MAKLIPLSQIPYAAREIEAAERRKWPTRAMALDAATTAIVLAPGCYGGPEAPRVGWVLTRAAAEALAAVVTRMPGGTSHHRLSYEDGYASSDALDEYIEAIAAGADKQTALAAYTAARAAE